jgi:hypothetical protein
MVEEKARLPKPVFPPHPALLSLSKGPEGRGEPAASTQPILSDMSDAAAPDDDTPPARFRWRHRTVALAAATGPERVVGPWWAADARWRDYWRVEDAGGRRLWLFRDLATGRWHVHGLFG